VLGYADIPYTKALTILGKTGPLHPKYYILRSVLLLCGLVSKLMEPKTQCIDCGSDWINASGSGGGEQPEPWNLYDETEN